MRYRIPLCGLPSLCLVAFLCVVGFASPAADDEEFANVLLTKAAWAALDQGHDPRLAISKAERCINKFGAQADAKQAELERLKARQSPLGAVSPEEKTAINQRGLLNDVATCYLIKGKAAEKLKLPDEAKAAYCAAAKYTYARCWDPHGWFWSPAEAACERLGDLKWTCKARVCGPA
jgi:hypothetical protein